MEISSGNIFLIAFYFIVIFAIGFWVKKKESVREYLNADRKIGLLQTTASISAVMGGMILVAQATLGFQMGIAAAWYFIGIAIGMTFIGVCAKKMKKITEEKNLLTLADYFKEKLDHKNKILSAIIIFIALFALLVGQFIAAGSLFSPLLGIHYAYAVLLTMAGVLAYLVLGGFKAVVKTDVLQFLIMAVVFGSILFVIDIGEYTPSQISITSIGGSYIFSFLIIGAFAMISGADIWQRVFAAKNAKTARNASFLSAGIFLLFGIVITVIGMAAKNHFPDIKPEEALYHGLFQLIPLPLVGIAVVFVLAAIMSTIDTELFYLSSSLSKDFLKKETTLPEEKLAKNIQKYILVLACVSAVTAIVFSNILTILFGIVSLSLAISPVLGASFIWKIKNNAAFLSMLAGLLSLVLLTVTGNFNADNSILPLPTAIIFLIIGQIIFRKNKSK
ncbi:MAG: hypothetical protein COV59_03885 [Candidatus Magasanikbacteria bacterium CG11_big_fil_rev_8_21_14_0_20_39_34]|uniref:Sodium:solute symporter n=1 Tax=Candidatus Magasanikbacteria bacterium CG11_big_fil_rev_8_21_14_0_20_39_34 TaxID=1974653 RepID=A0A2H0N6R1_9BACT|nr:MAG: hypothetical protein COV59_03885 [Candidatus Magasanikbacteria bacterium CG11_big_fil_rev_8_21_14_0_20_39_34]